MRILIVHNFYKQKGGGEDVVFEREKQALGGYLGEENVFTYTATSRSIRIPSLLTSIFFSREHYRGVYRLVKDKGIDVVHIHNFFPVLSASVFKAAKDAGAKVVHTVHNYRWWCMNGNFYREAAGICTRCARPYDFYSAIRFKCYRNSYLQTILAKLAFAYYKFTNVLQKTDLFFALTGFEQLQMIGLGLDPAKIRVKPNLVTPVSFTAAEKEGYVYVGRLDPSKGIVFLLDTWQQLPPHFKLTVIGTSELEEDLRAKYASANIFFKGYCDTDETRRLIAASRYAVQPSLLYETFGLTIIESMNAGVPVIGLNIGTRPELISHGETGFISSPGELKNTILQSYDYQDYDQMSANAITFARSFSTDAVVEKQVAFYRQLLEQQ